MNIDELFVQAVCDKLHRAGELHARRNVEQLTYEFYFYPVDKRDDWMVGIALRKPTLYKVVRAINYYIDSET